MVYFVHNGLRYPQCLATVLQQSWFSQNSIWIIAVSVVLTACIVAALTWWDAGYISVRAVLSDSICSAQDSEQSRTGHAHSIEQTILVHQMLHDPLPGTLSSDAAIARLSSKGSLTSGRGSRTPPHPGGRSPLSSRISKASLVS